MGAEGPIQRKHAEPTQMESKKADSRRTRQPVGNEEAPNLTIFFKCFLITPEGMDDDLGFSVTPQKRVGFGRREPQIVAHVEVGCRVHYEKAHEKGSQIRFLGAG